MDIKDAATVAPGGVALIISYLNIVEVTLSISLLSASLAFLIWRWWKMAREK